MFSKTKVQIACIAIHIFASLLAVTTSCSAEPNPTKSESSSPAGAWSGQQYLDLSQNIHSGKLPLPRLSDPQGKILLENITATNNLAKYRDKTLLPGKRIIEFRQMQSGANSIYKAYAEKLNAGELMHAEFAQLTVFMLRLTSLGGTITQEYVATLPNDPAKKQTLDNSLSKGVLRMIGNCIGVTQNDSYSRELRAIILAAVKETLPEFKLVLLKEDHSRLRVLLDQALSKQKHESERSQIEAILKELGE